ncbi:hypothetical protein BDZ45DRAFT_151978 [Acephala macrosclerotiorum]|nr:hypothetical protein BDZ45DRAFT_151978 [Acephala macrosclerotiorum]
MGLLNSLGEIAAWMSTSQSNNNFYLVRTPLFKQFLDICVWNYPDPLDLYAWSYEIVPMYFFAGAIDYGIMVFFISLYSQYSFIAMARGTPATAPSLLAELQDPRSKTFQALFLLSFALRVWNLGIENIKRTCNFHSLQWPDMRKLTILVLLLCPALFWNWFLENAFSILGLDRDRPRLVQLFRLILSRDWDIAQLYSGFFVSKGVEALQQESAARLNETWGGFVKRCIKITLIATPLEMFVKNLRYMVVALVFAIGRNGPAIGAFFEELIQKLRKLSLVDRFLAIDNAVSAKRDVLLLLLIRYFRRGRTPWHGSKFPQYLANVRQFIDANLKPILLTFQRFVESVLRGLLRFTNTILRRCRQGRYFKTSRRNQTSEGPRSHRFRLL